MSVITVRLAYEVRGVVKFLSHLDILKLFNRALRRAGLPLVYSEGFNPHARISFGPPRGVGQEGLAEYCDLQLQAGAGLAAAEVCSRLNQALPKGVRVLEGRILAEPRPALMAEINLAVYEAELGNPSEPAGVETAYLRKRLAEFEAAERVEVWRHHPKKRDKLIDLKAGVNRLELLPEGRLRLEIPFGAAGSVKPAEVMSWLAGEQELDYQLSRVGLYIVGGDGERRLP